MASSRRLTRREFLRAGGSLAAAGALGGLFGRRARSAGRPPNILYVLADDLGYGDLGCYGQKTIRTPHLDWLAAQGMRCTDHYAGSTVCAPSRCCLMTGLHTGHCRVRGNDRTPLAPDDVTVAEILREAGYATGLVGKWGLGEEGTTGVPARQGFDHFFGYLNQRHAHNSYPEFLFRNEERVKLRNVLAEPSAGGWGAAKERVDYSHDLFVEDAFDFIERNRERPFFLYLALTIPHANNEAGAMEVPSDEPYSNEKWPPAQRNHAAMITRMDRDVGRLMALLEDLGLDENTALFFSSDNGPHQEGGARPEFFDSNGALKGIKRDLYEGGIRVPLIVRWPAHVRPGSVCRHVSAFWDFPATAAAMAGIRPPRGGDGISFLPALRGEKQPEHDYLYWEFAEQGGSQAVRQGRWKAVRRNVKKDPDGTPELYDLSIDPGEKRGLAGANPAIVDRMTKIMRAARAPSRDFPLLPGDGD